MAVETWLQLGMIMQHIVVLNPKGGCGKTTIATHLAVYASTLGLRVALADHDKQASSHDWIASRPRRCADIGTIAAYDGEAFDGPSIENNYDVIVHDLPASLATDSSTDSFDLRRHCNKMIIPIMPSPIDIKAAMRLWTQLSENGILDEPAIKIGLVANRVKSHTRYTKVLDDFIERLGIPKVATLRDTQNYIRSLDAGLSLFDLPPNRVADDLIQWQPLMEWTGFFDIEDGELLDLLDMEGLQALGLGQGLQKGVQEAGEQLVSFEDMQLEQLEDELVTTETEEEYYTGSY